MINHFVNEDFVNNAANKQKTMWKIISQEKGKIKKEENSNLTAEDLHIFFATVGETTAPSIPLNVNITAEHLLQQDNFHVTKYCFLFDTTEFRKIFSQIKPKKSKLKLYNQ